MNEKLTTDTQTDWAKLARRDDNEIDYSDAPAITVEVDTEILTWFKSHQANYQATINQLLRTYIQEHEHDLVK